MAESGEASESAVEWLMSAAQQAQRPSEPGRKPRNEADAAAAMEAMASSGEASESAVRWLRTDPPAQDQRPVAGAERLSTRKAELAKAAMRSDVGGIRRRMAVGGRGARPDRPQDRREGRRRQGGASRRAHQARSRPKARFAKRPARARCRAGNAARGIGREGFRAFEIARHNDAQPKRPRSGPEAAGAAHVAECAPTPEEPAAAPAPEPAPSRSRRPSTPARRPARNRPACSDPARHGDAHSGKPAKKRKDWSNRRRALIAVASPIDPGAASRVAFRHRANVALFLRARHFAEVRGQIRSTTTSKGCSAQPDPTGPATST